MESLSLKPRIGRNMRMRPRGHRSTIEHRLAAAVLKPVKAKRISIQEYDKKATDDLIAAADGSSVEYLGGAPVQSQLVQVPLDKIDLWTANPRTFCACDDTERTPAQELDILLKEHDTAELALQLAFNRGVPDALVGIAKPNGHVETVDGNRRATASKVCAGLIDMPKEWSKTLKQEITDILAEQPFPKTVPVKVYKNITREQLESFLAIKHGSKIRGWGSLQKGQFAYKLLCDRTDMNLTCESAADLRRAWKELTQKSQNTLKTIALQFGTRPDKLRPYIMATIANTLYCNQYDVKDQGDRFTYFAKFYSKKWFKDMADNVQPTLAKGKDKEDFLWPDTAIETKFMQWLAGNLITDCVHVDALHYIMNDKATYAIFQKDGFQDAYDYLNVKLRDDTLDKALEEVEVTEAENLKTAHGNGRRKQLRDLKVAIASLEHTLGEAL